MMGIAGGLRGKMTLGEAIVPERVVYYESAAALADSVLAAQPEMQRPGMATLQDLSTCFSSPSLSDRLQERAKALGVSLPKESAAGEAAPKFKASTATIVSGEKLIRDSEFFARLRQIHDKACVAEMEAYGVVVPARNKTFRSWSSEDSAISATTKRMIFSITSRPTLLPLWSLTTSFTAGAGFKVTE